MSIDLPLQGKNLLVVDDEIDLRDIVASELEFMGAKVFQAENISKAVDVLKNNSIDLVISDIRMPGGSGIELMRSIKASNVYMPPVVLITGFADISVEAAFNEGAEGLMSKPFRLDDLILAAVRHTRPLDERFQQQIHYEKEIKLNFKDTFSACLNNHQVAIGRGGLTLIVPLDEVKSEAGETFKFNLSFQDKTISGIGICRWWKSMSVHSAVMGFEFYQLTPDSLNDLKKCWGEKLVPFIPIL
jgi:CheY-like chemotaxis protein